MSSPSDARDVLTERLNTAGRRMGMATIFFHQAVAEKAGLLGTDHKHLDLLLQEGPMTAGRLAELSGLTTGAVTGVIDRLEDADLVRRERDPDDRRKVIVVLQEENARRKLGPIFASMLEDLHTLNARYSDEELAVIVDYMEHCTDFLREQAKKLRETG